MYLKRDEKLLLYNIKYHLIIYCCVIPFEAVFFLYNVIIKQQYINIKNTLNTLHRQMYLKFIKIMMEIGFEW